MFTKSFQHSRPTKQRKAFTLGVESLEERRLLTTATLANGVLQIVGTSLADTITVRHLVEHKGGWDRGTAGDPMFRPLQTAKALGVPSPASARDVVRYMTGQPLSQKIAFGLWEWGVR